MTIYAINETTHLKLKQTLVLTNNLLATANLAPTEKDKMQHLNTSLDEIIRACNNLQSYDHQALVTMSLTDATTKLSNKLGILWQPKYADMLHRTYPQGISFHQLIAFASQIEKGEI